MTTSKTIATECRFCGMPLLIVGDPTKMTPPVHLVKTKRGGMIYFHRDCFFKYVLESVDNGKKNRSQL